MYTKEEREGILWEYHRSGMSVPEACRRLPLFPNRDNLYRWLRMEEAGGLAAAEMPDRAARMHCAHGEGSPRHAARARRGREGAGVAEGPEQTEWRDWGADLPEDPAERARTAEARLAEALAVLDVLKAPGPASLTSMEKWRAGELARGRCPLVGLRDVTETLSMPKGAYLDQAARASRPDPKAALRVRVRASFAASGGVCGAGSVTADLRSGEGQPVSWRDLAPGDMTTPVVASEKVVRATMAEEGLVARKAAQMARRARYSSYAGGLSERPANLPLAEDGTHDFHAPEPGLLVVTDVTEFKLDGYKAYLSPAIDCFDGWPVRWSVSRHPDKALVLGMLSDLVDEVRPTGGRPLVLHTDGGSACMTGDWAEACEAGHVTRSMSRKARSPDNARAEGFFGTPECDFFEGRDWSGVGYEEFAAELDRHIEWYRSGKVKRALGWKTIRQAREEMVRAA